MKVYVINLDKNVDRLAKVSGQLRLLSVQFERVRAVDGRQLSLCEKRAAYSRFLWWCTQGYPARDGELGCCLSHKKAYAALLASSEQCACILEDDAILDPEFPSQLKRVGAWIQKDRPQVVLLANHNQSADNSWHVKRLYGGSFAEGYVVNRLAAKALICGNTPIRTTNDKWTYWARCNLGKGIIDLYQAYPPVVLQEWQKKDYVSDVCPAGSFSALGFTGMRKWMWVMKRLVGKMFSVLLPVTVAKG